MAINPQSFFTPIPTPVPPPTVLTAANIPPLANPQTGTGGTTLLATGGTAAPPLIGTGGTAAPPTSLAQIITILQSLLQQLGGNGFSNTLATVTPPATAMPKTLADAGGPAGDGDGADGATGNAGGAGNAKKVAKDEEGGGGGAGGAGNADGNCNGGN